MGKLKHAPPELRGCCFVLLVTLAIAPLGCKRQEAAGRHRAWLDRSHGRAPDREPARERLLRNRAERLAVDGAAVQRGAAAAVRCEPEGATLRLRLSVPPVIVEKLKTITLSATIGGSALAPKPTPSWGLHVHARRGAGASGGRILRVDSNWTNPCRPTGADLRDLGLVVLSAGLG